MDTTAVNRITASFRDPSGFLFTKGDDIYRQINESYRNDYKMLISSGLYDELVKRRMLIPHEEVDPKLSDWSDAYKVIKPEKIPLISYPYEWSFSQLKEASLLTLGLQETAYKYGMYLKDASSYNIQFHKGRAIFIDTLSFSKYEDGMPWTAYRQFCQHFLAPLALMSYKDIRLSNMLKSFIDGIPLDLASKLLPIRSRFNLGLYFHIHVHSRYQKKYENKTIDKSKVKVSELSYKGLTESLKSAVKKLKWEPKDTEWYDYYKGNTNYSTEGMKNKAIMVEEYIDHVQPKVVWDLGSNIGYFSRIASRKGIYTVSFDIDPACVEINQQQVIQNKEKNILPLIIDLTNPTPEIGWENKERMSFMDRSPVDLAMALALIHHLAISNNLPLDYIAEFFSRVCHWLIIEFVPKSDSQVKRLLSTREDIFPNYTKEDFERQFSRYFSIVKSKPVKNSKRTLYLMQKIK